MFERLKLFQHGKDENVVVDDDWTGMEELNLLDFNFGLKKTEEETREKQENTRNQVGN